MKNRYFGKSYRKTIRFDTDPSSNKKVTDILYQRSFSSKLKETPDQLQPTDVKRMISLRQKFESTEVSRQFRIIVLAVRSQYKSDLSPDLKVYLHNYLIQELTRILVSLFQGNDGSMNLTAKLRLKALFPKSKNINSLASKLSRLLNRAALEQSRTKVLSKNIQSNIQTAFVAFKLEIVNNINNGK